MIFRSTYPDVSVPAIAFSPFVLQNALKMGDKPALIDGPTGRTITYTQLYGGAYRVAANLAARGFGKGDVFAILLPNVPEYAIAFHGISLAGGTVTTMNPLYTPDELAFQLNDTSARYILTIPMLMEKAVAAKSKSKVEEIFVLGEAEGAIPFMSLLQEAGAPPQIEYDLSKDLIVLPYSSGTTGLPKGVMLTHQNIVSQICQLEPIVGFTAEDVSIAVLPFFHIYGMVGIMNLCLYMGCTLVTMPRFDMEQFLQLMQDYKVTSVGLVPPIILGLAKHPIVDKYDLSSLKWINSGAAPLDEALQQACADRLKCTVFQGYGMTETSVAIATSNDKPGGAKIGSSGKLIPNEVCRIMDYQTGQEVDEYGKRGEIWVQGPNIMLGYLHREHETAHTIDADGWLHTGDIGYIDEDGFLFVVDRIKELIKYKGLQVAPAELEAILLTHPAVTDAAVIGRPDEEAGEIPKAFVVTKSEISAEELMEYVAGKVAPHKKIRMVEFTSEIPKSASGKILRRILLDQEKARM